MSYEQLEQKIGAGFYILPHLRDKGELARLWCDIMDLSNKEDVDRIVKLAMKGKQKRWIVSAALRIQNFWLDGSDFLITSPRHLTQHLGHHLKRLSDLSPEFDKLYREHRFHGNVEQGFVDQYSNYLSREEAMECVRFNDQDFSIERSTGSKDALHSEDLYGWQRY